MKFKLDGNEIMLTRVEMSLMNVSVVVTIDDVQKHKGLEVLFIEYEDLF